MAAQFPSNPVNGPSQEFQRPYFNPAGNANRPPGPTRPPLPNGYPGLTQFPPRPSIPGQGSAFSQFPPLPPSAGTSSLAAPPVGFGGSSPRPQMGKTSSTPVLSASSSEPASNRTSTNPSPVSVSRFDQLEGQFLPPSGAASPAGSSTNLYAMNQDSNVPYPHSTQVNGTSTPRIPPAFANSPRAPSVVPPPAASYQPVGSAQPPMDPRWTGSPYRPQMQPPLAAGAPPPPRNAMPPPQMFPGQFQTPQPMPGQPTMDSRGPYPPTSFASPVASPQYAYGQQVDHVASQMGSLSVTQHGYDKLWGNENVDLLQVRHMSAQTEPPKIRLKQEHLNAYNCSPDIFRPTLTKIPETGNLLKKTRLPLGLLIHPFKDLTQLPVIQCQTIVRCRACRTYINPFVYFVDQRRWKCNLCFRINELPDEFQYDPISKTYGDPSRRPEVKNATIEYIAPAEYMLRPPQPAVYLYVLDVCHHAIDTGYLKLFCDVLLEELDRIPGDSRTQIGFITFDASVHFYRMAEGLSQPHQMIVSDVDDIFLPCPNDLLVNLSENKQLITDLLEQLPTKFNNSPHTSSALGAALQAAYKLVSPTGGRVTVFQTCLPNAGPGALKSREDPNQRSSKDVPHLNPATDFYKSLALECCGQQVAVDLFLLGSQYMDIASLACVAQYSGGSVHHFPGFHYMHNPVQSERFERCFRRYLTRKIGLEAVMRVRCTRGLSIHTFHGNFFVRSTDLLSLPNINPDAGFGLQVSIEESLTDVQNVCFQAALLYTSSKGERRIRVHTICLPITGSAIEAIQSADQQCIVGLLAKMAVDRSLQSSLSDARDASVNVCIDVLSAYKAAQSGAYGLSAPGNLRLLPLYVSAMLKTVALRTGTSTRLDDRVFAMTQFKTLPLYQLLQMIYPDLYAVHNLTDQGAISVGDMVVAQPPRLSLTAEKIDANGAYILDMGDTVVLFINRDVNPAFLQNALGVNTINALPENMFELPELETPESERLRNFVTYLQNQKPYPAVIQIAADSSQSRSQFFSRLVEDRTESSLSYYEFLQHLKNQIK